MTESAQSALVTRLAIAASALGLDDLEAANLFESMMAFERWRREIATSVFVHCKEGPSVKGAPGTRVAPGMIVATSYLGFPLATIAFVAQTGSRAILVAGPIAPEVSRFLERHGAGHVCIAGFSPRRVIKIVSAIRATGAIPVILIDAPCHSRRTFACLGFQVRCSRLVEVCAAYEGIKPLVLFTDIYDSRTVNVAAAPIGDEDDGLTAALLDTLAGRIRLRPSQYRWRPDCFLMSSPGLRAGALDRALRLLGR